MLQAIRSKATGIVVQVLFGLLILTFALWGIGDIFRGRSTDTTVATVGGLKISAEEVSEELRHQLERLRQQTGASLTQDQIKELDLVNTTLDSVIDRHLLDREAARLGLAVNDDAVRQAIVGNPSFRGSDGAFDRNVYAQLLAANQMTDQQFETMLRGELIRGMIIDPVTAGAGAPPELIDALWHSRGERRTADAVLLAPSAIGAVGTPDPGALEKFYDEHKDEFLLPERRSFSVAMLDPGTLAASIIVPEEKIQAEYKARIDEFRTPEKRTLEQILVPDEAKAKAAQAALAAGKDFAQVAHDVAGENKDAVELGALTRDDLPGELGKVAFALKAGEVSQPVKDPFGWHIVKLVSVTLEAQQSYADVKDKLGKSLARDQAADELSKTANAIDDALAGGAKFSDIVAKFNLKPVAVADVDETGHLPDGKAAPIPAPAEDILKNAFAAKTTGLGDLRDTPDQGFYLIDLDKIAPAEPQPLTQIHDKAVAAWQQAERRARLAKLGDDMAKAVNAGQHLDELAAMHGFKPFVTKPLSRYQSDAELPATLLPRLFAAKRGQAVAGPADGDKGYIVATVADILPPDPALEASQKAEIARQIDQQTKGDLLDQYEKALGREYPVTRDSDAINRLL
jgi:peptidyl-prolyl cis-trans isomerase D